MAIHRDQLPVPTPCDGFVPRPGASDRAGWCTRCRKHVHDLSAMRESELRRFLEARVGTEICVAYTTDARGVVQLRSESRLRVAPLAAMVVLLAACAGYGTELESPDSPCIDAQGYEVSCDEALLADMASTPEDVVPVSSEDPESSGCPIRPTRPTGSTIVSPPRDEHDPLGLRPGQLPPEVSAEASSEAEAEPRPVAGYTTRGAMMVTSVVNLPPEYAPSVSLMNRGGYGGTVPIWELRAEAKERRAERRNARFHRQRRRARQRAGL